MIISLVLRWLVVSHSPVFKLGLFLRINRGKMRVCDIQCFN